MSHWVHTSLWIQILGAAGTIESFTLFGKKLKIWYNTGSKLSSCQCKNTYDFNRGTFCWTHKRYSRYVVTPGVNMDSPWEPVIEIFPKMRCVITTEICQTLINNVGTLDHTATLLLEYFFHCFKLAFSSYLFANERSQLDRCIDFALIWKSLLAIAKQNAP